MDLVSLILFCALSTAPNVQVTLYQIAQTTNSTSTFIDDLTEAKVYTPVKPQRAARITNGLLASGHELRLGLMNLPASVLDTYSLRPRQLFRSCKNVSVASDRLAVSMGRYDDPHRALAYYFSGDPDDHRALHWANRVLAADTVDLQKVARDSASAPPSPQFHVEQHLFVSPDEDISSSKTPRRRPSSLSRANNSSRPPERSDSSTAPTKFPPPDSVEQTSEETVTPDDSSSTQPSLQTSPQNAPPSTSSTFEEALASPSQAPEGTSGQPTRRRPGGAYPDVTHEKLKTSDGESSDAADDKETSKPSVGD